jgi:hypothetical protein
MLLILLIWHIDTMLDNDIETINYKTANAK